MMNVGLTTFAASAALGRVEWTQTARHGDGSLVLLKDMPPLEMKPAARAPKRASLVLDRTKRFQQYVGFGGAFTEAAAINWRKLSPERQQEVIDRCTSNEYHFVQLTEKHIEQEANR